MDRLLFRFERRFGRHAIAGLATYLVGATALCSVIGFVQPEILLRLLFVPRAIFHGEVWRLFTFFFVPSGAAFSGPIGLALYVMMFLPFIFSAGASLEDVWGAFRLNAYVFTGMVAMIIAGLSSGQMMQGSFILEGILLAAATMFPTYEFNLYFFIPLQLKWLGAIVLGEMLYEASRFGLGTQLSAGVVIVNYLLYCGPQLRVLLRGGAPRARTSTPILSRRSAPPPKTSRSA